MRQKGLLCLLISALIACGGATGPITGPLADGGEGPDGGEAEGDAGDESDGGDDQDGGDEPDAGSLPDASMPDASLPPRLELFEGPPLEAPDEVLGTGQGLGRNVQDASHDAEGNLWAVDGSRVYVRRAGMGAFESFGTGHGLSSDDVLAVSGGTAGTAWVGYRGQGDDATGEPVEWRYTGGAGKVELEGADLRVTNMKLISPPGMYSQYPEGRYKLRTCIRAYAVKHGPHAGDAWFGCNHGVALVSTSYGVEEHHHPILCVWDPVRARCTEKAGWVGALAFTPGGDVWMGGTYGVMLLDYSNGSAPGNFWGPEPVHNGKVFLAPLRPNSFGSEDIVGVAAGEEDSVWAVSSHSGLAHRRADGSIELYQEADGLFSNRLVDVAMDTEGGLWIASADAGIVRLDTKSGEWRRATGLPSSLVARLVAEEVAGEQIVTATVREAIVLWKR